MLEKSMISTMVDHQFRLCFVMVEILPKGQFELTSKLVRSHSKAPDAEGVLLHVVVVTHFDRLNGRTHQLVGM